MTRQELQTEWLKAYCPTCANNDDRGTEYCNCQAEYEKVKIEFLNLPTAGCSRCKYFETYTLEEKKENSKDSGRQRMPICGIMWHRHTLV